MEELTPGVIERWFTPEFRKREPATVQKIVRMLHTTPAHGYAASCSAIRDMDQRELIRAVTNPVLVVVGSRDPATPPEMGRHIANTIPGARIVTLEAAHLSNIEQADAFNQAVIDFLTAREVGPARRVPPRHAAGASLRGSPWRAKPRHASAPPPRRRRQRKGRRRRTRRKRRGEKIDT